MDISKITDQIKALLKSKKVAPIKTPKQKRKQSIVLGVIVLSVGALLYLIWAFDADTSTVNIKPKDTGETRVRFNVEPEQKWEAYAESQVKQNAKGIQALNQGQQAFTVQMKELADNYHTLNGTVKNIQFTLRELANKKSDVPTPHQSANPAQSKAIPSTTGDKQVVPLNTNNATYSGEINTGYRTPTIHVWHLSQTPTSKPLIHKQIHNDQAGYLPISNFTAFLLHGFSAHTGADNAKQSNMSPVQMVITSNAITPNGHKYWLKGCRLLGSAYGDLSSMRVDLRLKTLECLDPATGHWFVSQNLKGYVVDSDGMLGLRADKYKSYQQARLRMAFLSSAIAGAGKAFSQGQGTTSLNPLGGSTQIVNGSEVARQALGGGLSGGADQLAKFYIQQAKMLSPVLIVYGGRVVSVNLTQGVVLKWQDRHDHYVSPPEPQTRNVNDEGIAITQDSIKQANSKVQVANTFTQRPINDQQIAKATAKSNYATQLSGMYMDKRKLNEAQRKASSAFNTSGERQ